MYHLRFCFILKEVLRFFTANLQKRVLWNSARSHLLHTITPIICGFRNLRYFARSQNQQIAGFYCIRDRKFCLDLVVKAKKDQRKAKKAKFLHNSTKTVSKIINESSLGFSMFIIAQTIWQESTYKAQKVKQRPKNTFLF